MEPENTTVFYSAVRTAGGHAVFGRTAGTTETQQALQAICMWSAQADPRGFLKTPGSMRAYILGAFLCTGP